MTHAQVDRLSQHLWPNRPGWVGTVLGLTGIAAMAADVIVTRRINAPLPEDKSTEAVIDLYREEADRLRQERRQQEWAAAHPAPSGGEGRASGAAQPSAAAVAIAVATAPPSAYLASEGARESPTGVEEGCVPCALGHLGATQGMLERAAEAAEQEGRCGQGCQAWLVPAVREPLALLRHDWTLPRIAETTPEQRRAITEHMSEVVRLKDALVAGADPDPDRKAVREAIVGASASIIEATRFTDSGDPVTHPLVQKRLSSAEPDLLAGERGRTTALPAPVKAAVRQNRQDLLNRVREPADLSRVAAQAEVIDRQVMAPAVEGLRPEDVRHLAAEAGRVRRSFKAAVAAAAEPVQRQIAAAAGVPGGGEGRAGGAARPSAPGAGPPPVQEPGTGAA